jgi:hypothetical protein
LLVQFLLNEPDLFSDYRRTYKYPLLAKETFLILFEEIKEIFFQKENGLAIRFVSYLSGKFNPSSTIPGFLQKIILKYLLAYPVDFAILLREENLIPRLFINIDNDSVSNILQEILSFEIKFSTETSEVNSNYFETIKVLAFLLKKCVKQEIINEINISLKNETSGYFDIIKEHEENTKYIYYKKQSIENILSLTTRTIRKLNMTACKDKDSFVFDLLNNNLLDIMINSSLNSIKNDLNDHSIKLGEILISSLSDILKIVVFGEKEVSTLK